MKPLWLVYELEHGTITCMFWMHTFGFAYGVPRYLATWDARSPVYSDGVIASVCEAKA